MSNEERTAQSAESRASSKRDSVLEEQQRPKGPRPPGKPSTLRKKGLG